MPRLDFKVQDAEPVLHALVPTLVFRLRISDTEAQEAELAATIQSVLLRCQIFIEPARRHYAPDEQDPLRELFGDPSGWGRTLQGMLWTDTQAIVPPFTGSTVIDLPVPCTCDFNVGAAKYFHDLEAGEVPLAFLLNGTMFYTAGNRGLSIAEMSWEKELDYQFPIRIWQEMMDAYYPNSTWLFLRKDVFERLYQYRADHGQSSWEQAVESLLSAVHEHATP